MYMQEKVTVEQKMIENVRGERERELINSIYFQFKIADSIKIKPPALNCGIAA